MIANVSNIDNQSFEGLILRNVLKSTQFTANRFAWSSDGCFLASPHDDGSIFIWDVEKGEYKKKLQMANKDRPWVTTWSPNNKILCVGSSSGRIYLLETEKWALLPFPDEHINNADGIFSLSWSQDGTKLASGCYSGKINIWATNNWKLLRSIEEQTTPVKIVKWSPDSDVLASGSDDGLLCIRKISENKNARTLKGHSSEINDIAWMANGKMLVSASSDSAIRVWHPQGNAALHALEGHTSQVISLSFSHDGKMMASKSLNEVRIWLTETWETIEIIDNSGSINWASNLAFHPQKPILADYSSANLGICLYDLDLNILLNQEPKNESIRYTTAKIVLVGDSGVGKTGLGWRLAHGEFKEHSSTHGQQFWVINELKNKRTDGTECEAVLWDLAGQHIYRAIHSIFLENLDASLILFDPTNRQEPLKGAQFWIEQLKGKKHLPPSVLVGGRVDRGAPALSQEELDRFCQCYGISGGYISTSARSGEGLESLLAILRAQIPWDQITATVTTVTFKRIKEYVLMLKEKTDRKTILVRPEELRKQLEAIDKDWQFSDNEMMTAVKHLETHGYVTILKSSAGDEYILLAPDFLVSLASSIVLKADKNPLELGAISETELFQDKYSFDELNGLEQSERQILLDAAILRFLEHSICFRETLGNDTLLIFPSLIKQKRPLQDKFQSVDDMTYIVRGRIENIYSALVVLLGYTSSFTRINQWQNQAQYEMGTDEICGFRVIEDREGEQELVLYYSIIMPAYGRILFRGLFESFLYKRDADVTRFPPVYCPNNHLLQRAAVIKRVRDGKDFIFCDECGGKTFLPESENIETLGVKETKVVERGDALARLRNTYETYLVRVKSFRRDRAVPRCYISHANDYFEWVATLTHDLRDAGVIVIDNKAQIQTTDFILQVCTPKYKQDWDLSTGNVGNDSLLIQSQLNCKSALQPLVIPLLREGAAEEAIPRELRRCKPADFRDSSTYPISLFDLVLSLYAIPLNHAAFIPLRDSMQEQWRQSQAGMTVERNTTDENQNTPIKIFVSYAHKDEEYKNELLTMLDGLQRRGLIDIWQDREIEEGDEWRYEIEKAMNQCELALLLISKHFLASRFIQDTEVPNLLQRRKATGLRVVPVIICPCLWQSEPVLSDIQALPRDAVPVNSFLEGNERDQVWLEIAQAIERRANEYRRIQQTKLK
jgi:small GTP-binding protein